MKASLKLMPLFTVISLTVFLFAFELPTGWIEAGSQPQKYDMGIDIGAGRDGKNAATIKSKVNKINGFGTLMQTCLPDQFLGKRVRLSGWVKTKDVKDWAGLWFRIDGKDSKELLGFDNMKNGKKNRAISGSTDWTLYEIILDVPIGAVNLAYGALIVGTGQIWFDDIQFEVVDNTTPTTGKDKDLFMPFSKPSNLNFDN